mgnify:CR=1 FL=1
MRVFGMIRLLATDLEPTATKIHLASWNGINDPLDVFLAGRFEDWQSFQGRRNFERPFVLSLIQTRQRDH